MRNPTWDKIEDVKPPEIPECVSHRFSDNAPQPQPELGRAVHVDGGEGQEVAILHVQVEPLAHADVEPRHDQE